MRQVGDPEDIPQQPPTVEVAQQIFLAFQAEVRHLKYVLTTQRVKQAKQRRRERARLVFKDIARDRPQPVDVLTHAPHAVVVAVDQAEGTVEFEPPDVFSSDKQVYLNGKSLDPIVVAHDTAWIDPD